MPNAYDSLYTGPHNDEYNTRISGLEGKTTTHTSQIDILQNSTTAIATTANSKVSKTGDTMTGSLNIKETTVTLGTTQTTDYYGKGFYIKDSGGTASLSYVNDFSLTTGEQGVQLGTSHPVDGTIKYNTLRLGLNNSGTATVALSQLAWRKALGLEDRVYCYVYYAASGDVSFSTWVKFNTVVSDTKNAYSTSTGQFTVPSSGYYLCNFGYYSNTTGANTAHRPAIGLLNSDGTTKDFVMGMGNISTSISHVWYCEAGEKLVAGTYNSSWSISFYASKNHNYFSILKL